MHCIDWFINNWNLSQTLMVEGQTTQEQLAEFLSLLDSKGVKAVQNDSLWRDTNESKQFLRDDLWKFATDIHRESEKLHI